MTDNILQSAESPKRSFLDRLRIETFLTRLEWHLEGAVTGKVRRATARELREALTSDPRGTATAIEDLGPPRVLAHQYSEQGSRRPLWSIGIVAAGLTLLVYWTAFLSFVFGMLAVVDSGASGEAYATFFFVDVTAYSTADTFGIWWAGGWAWIIVPFVLCVISFLLAARSWRIATARRSSV